MADGVSVSESFISKLENDKVQPSLAVLHKLVAFLGVNVSSLFGDLTEDESPLFVMRAGERPVIRTSLRHQTDGVNIEVVTPISRKSLLQASIHEVATVAPAMASSLTQARRSDLYSREFST